jgi:fatty-acid desaturase
MPFSFELMKSYTIIAYNFIFIKFTIIEIKISYHRISENRTYMCGEHYKYP